MTKYKRGFEFIVMPGLVPGIHVFFDCRCKDVDAHDERRHDEVGDERKRERDAA